MFGNKMNQSLEDLEKKLEQRDFSQASLGRDLKFPRILLSPKDRPAGDSFMVPSNLKIDEVDLSVAKFGKPIIQHDSENSGSRQKVRIPIEKLQLQADLSLACRESACEGRELLGFQGLAVSVSESNAVGLPGPFIEFDLEMSQGSSLGNALSVDPSSVQVHLPMESASIDLGSADPELLGRMESTLGSAEFLQLKALLDRTSTEDGLRAALESDEMRLLDQRFSGIGEHMAEHFTLWCSGKHRPFAPMTSQEFFNELTRETLTLALKPRIANRSSLDALLLARQTWKLAAHVTRTTEMSADPLQAGIFELLNEKLAPALAEEVKKKIQGDDLDALARIRPAPGISYHPVRWSPAPADRGGIAATLAQAGCPASKKGDARPETWLDTKLARELNAKSGAALAVSLSEINQHLSELAQSPLEKNGRAIAFSSPPRLVTQNGRLQLQLDAVIRQADRPKQKGTRIVSSVPVSFDPASGKIQLDFSQTTVAKNENAPLKNALESALGVRVLKQAVLQKMVLPKLNEKAEIDARLGDWTLHALRPSRDGSRLIIGVH
jgi:hypothetical protein